MQTAHVRIGSQGLRVVAGAPSALPGFDPLLAGGRGAKGQRHLSSSGANIRGKHGVDVRSGGAA